MTYEYRVRWRRQGWCQSQFRLYQIEGPAWALVERLEGNDPEYGHLAPLTFVTVEKREVAEWREVTHVS